MINIRKEMHNCEKNEKQKGDLDVFDKIILICVYYLEFLKNKCEKYSIKSLFKKTTRS